MGQDPKTQIIDLPLAGGLRQKQSPEWLDPTSGQTAITNGNFTYQGSISKRLGAKFVANNMLGAGNSPAISNPSTGLRATSWSQGQMAMAATDAASAGLYTAQPGLDTVYNGIGPLPNCRTVRRGLPNVVTTSLHEAYAPTVVDAPEINKRYAFYVNNGETWGVVFDGNNQLIGTPFVLYNQAANAISGYYIDAGGGQIVVLLQIWGSPATYVGLTINDPKSPWDSITIDVAPTSMISVDISPYTDDPLGGFFLVVQDLSGTLTMAYLQANWAIANSQSVSTGLTGISMCTVAGVFGFTGAVGVLWRTIATVGPAIRTDVWFASFTGDHTFTPIVSAIVIEVQLTPISGGVFDLALSGMLFQSGQFFFSTWNLQYPQGYGNPGIIAPLGKFRNINAATGLEISAGIMPLGMWPIGKPFSVLNAVYQPCVLQLGTLIETADNTGSGASQSEQCTLYLLKFDQFASGVQPVSTACVRQIDPIFSYQFLNWPTASLPQSQIYGNDFVIGVRTVGEDIPTTGYPNGPSWIVEYFFDLADQQLLFQTNEISGDLRVSGSVPFISDGTQTFEDSFFNYPEFVVAQAGSSGTSCVLNGTYQWAVVYTYTDASGQLFRSAPGFSLNTLTLTTGGPYPIINFPPVVTSYRNLLNPGSIAAEIYRNDGSVGGATLYLVGSTTAFPSAASTTSVLQLNATAFGTGYHTVSTITVTISGGGGSGATAIPILSGGGVSNLLVTGNGFGYGPSDNVEVLASGTGTGFIATAIIGWLPGPTTYGVIGINVTNAGSGFYGPIAISFLGGTGSGATATATASDILITGYQVTSGGINYITPPNVVVTDTFGSGATAVAVLAPLYNGTANLQYTDETPDAVGDITLDTSTVLYTTGGILDNVIPPTAAMQCIHWQRLWIVDETLVNIWFTKQIQTGDTPAFNEALTISYPDGGDITAIIGMDDKLVIFKLNSISVVYGQGPADNGQGSDLTQPQPIATDQGAIDWRSVVLFPGGLFFQSRTGLYVLDRSLQVSWVGKDVTDLLAQYPTVLSSTLVPSATQVRFVCQSEGNDGTVNSLSLTAPGSGYLITDNITVTITGVDGNGAGATATATVGISGTIIALTLTNGGAGYVQGATVAITGGSGAGATATATTVALPPTTIVLVYDYLFQSWTTHQYNQMATTLACETYATLVVQTEGGALASVGVPMIVGQNASMWRELEPNVEVTAGLFPYEDQDVLTNNYFVPTSVTSAWVKLQGIQGYQRARRAMLLTEMPDPAGLTLEIAQNYQPATVQSFTWTDEQIAELNIPQVEMHVGGMFNKQQALQVTISDVGGPLAQTGQGARFISVGIELQRIGDRWPQVAVGGRA